MELPEGYQLGTLFNIASRKSLDVFGKYEGVSRRKKWMFKEPDFYYKRRLIKHALSKAGD